MAQDLAGMLTGISSQQRVDPRLNMQQQQLAMGANAAEMMKGGIQSMTGQTDPSAQLQTQLSGKIANFSNLSPEEQKKIIGVLQATGQTALAGQLIGGTKERYAKGATFTVQDELGNDFITIPTVNSGTGEMELKYQPIGGGDAQPVGKTQITGGEFGMTASAEGVRKANAKGNESRSGETAKAFAQSRNEAVTLLPAMKTEMNKLRQSLQLLDQVETGGPVNLAKYGIEDFFGLTSGTRAELERELSMNILQSLKPLFGGLISEGERITLTGISANIKRGNPANRAILRSMIDYMQTKAENALLYTQADNQKEYMGLVKALYENPAVVEEEKEEEKTWESITAGGK